MNNSAWHLIQNIMYTQLRIHMSPRVSSVRGNGRSNRLQPSPAVPLYLSHLSLLSATCCTRLWLTVLFGIMASNLFYFSPKTNSESYLIQNYTQTYARYPICRATWVRSNKFEVTVTDWHFFFFHLLWHILHFPEDESRWRSRLRMEHVCRLLLNTSRSCVALAWTPMLRKDSSSESSGELWSCFRDG